MSTLQIMEAANLFCGDHDPTKSKHLSLSEITIPPLEEMFSDHHAGGSRVQIEVPLGIQKLAQTFKLVGWDQDLLIKFGLGQQAKSRFTAYGSLRDQRMGTVKQAKTITEGRLGKIEAESFKRGELQHHDYSINGIVHYELWIDGKEIYYWDFFTTAWRVNGVSQNSDERRALNIPV